MSRCKHPKWKIVARRFQPSNVTEISGRGYSVDEMKEVAFGFTTIEEQCDVCGKTEFRRVLGDQTSG